MIKLCPPLQKKSSFAFKIVAAFRAYLQGAPTKVYWCALEMLVAIHLDYTFIEPPASVKQKGN